MRTWTRAVASIGAGGVLLALAPPATAISADPYPGAAYSRVGSNAHSGSYGYLRLLYDDVVPGSRVKFVVRGSEEEVVVREIKAAPEAAGEIFVITLEDSHRLPRTLPVEVTYSHPDYDSRTESYLVRNHEDREITNVCDKQPRKPSASDLVKKQPRKAGQAVVGSRARLTLARVGQGAAVRYEVKVGSAKARAGRFVKVSPSMVGKKLTITYRVFASGYKPFKRTYGFGKVRPRRG